MINLQRYLSGKVKLWSEIVFSRLGLQNDFVGYETIIEYLKKNKIYGLNGDIVEIGAFMGGGTKKLARFFKQYNKKIIVIDTFDLSSDKTLNERNESMEYVYKKILGKRDVKIIFDEIISKESNIEVYITDSKLAQLPQSTKLCFSFVDGNHDPSYVENDFNLVWGKTVSGGVVCFHDYGGDLPETTKAIDNIISINKKKIKTNTIGQKSLIYIHKK